MLKLCHLQGRGRTMKKKVAKTHYKLNTYEQKIVQLCFDSSSIQNFTSGLKMVYALDDPPLFVNIEEAGDLKLHNHWASVPN